MRTNDGITSCYPYQIQFSNGSETCVNGVANITTGSGGNVGIGTSGRIPVYQGAAVIGSPYNNVMNADGNIGIGSVNPQTGLDISGGRGVLLHNGPIQNISSLNFNNGNIFNENTPQNWDEQLLTGSGSNIDAMTWKASGNVGIGSAYPGQALDVAGTIRTTDFITQGPSIDARAFGVVCDGVTDNAATLLTAMQNASSSHKKLIIPPGNCVVNSEVALSNVGHQYKSLNMEGGSTTARDSEVSSTITYNGLVSATTAVMSFDSLEKMTIKNLDINANNKAGYGLKILPDSANASASYGFIFEGDHFEKATNYGFYITGTSNGARFTFLNCHFYENLIGYYTGDANAVNEVFINSSFNSGNSTNSDSAGIKLDGGSFSGYGLEFSNNYTDIYLANAYNNLTLVGCWTEQSRQYIFSSYKQANGSNITIIGNVISSFPWSWWKHGPEGVRTQPTNDATQWAAISFDTDGASINVIGSTFIDPFGGTTVGSIAPTSIAGNQVNIRIPNAHTYPLDLNVLGTYFSNGIDGGGKATYTQSNGGTGIATVDGVGNVVSADNGTTNNLSYWKSGVKIGSASNLSYVGNNLGVGSATPGQTLDVQGTVRIFKGGSASKGVCWCADGVTLGYDTGIVALTGAATCNTPAGAC